MKRQTEEDKDKVELGKSFVMFWSKSKVSVFRKVSMSLLRTFNYLPKIFRLMYVVTRVL